ncbi:IclR family transcriptional regulator [Haloactinopolyspora alba]|uniref:IclR family transcriptional regulator n=1 Tax=Haloactinopolyspora alba TaxID=648780 RepID=UPI001B800936|nr:IclR family transcriptional regulator [Haloactinopolyspora alba]
MTDAQFQPVKSADRTLEILEVLADAPERIGLGHLARTLSIPKSSLHGILRTMVRRGWVETDDSGQLFGLGVRSLLVGASYVDRDDAVTRAQPLLDWLNAQVGETTHLGRLDGSDVVYLAKRESSHPLRMYSAIGRRLPAHATALGKALLAARDDGEVADLLPARLPTLTLNTIGDRDDLLAELDRIRAVGYAIDREENSEGIRCFAVSLRTSRPPVDAVSVSAPTLRLDTRTEQRIIDVLVQANERLLSPRT